MGKFTVEQTYKAKLSVFLIFEPSNSVLPKQPNKKFRGFNHCFISTATQPDPDCDLGTSIYLYYVSFAHRRVNHTTLAYYESEVSATTWQPPH